MRKPCSANPLVPEASARTRCGVRQCAQGIAAPGLTRSPLLAGVACAAALVLAACAGGKEPSFYTLQAPAESAISPSVRAASVLVVPGPVRVPDALDKPEVVVLSGAQQVIPLPTDLWRSQFGEEVKTAVMGAVLADGRIAQAPAAGYAQGNAIAQYALHLGVDRMDLALGQYARLDATWSLQRLPAGMSGAPVVCRASWQRSLSGSTVQDAVAAQQQLVQDWGFRIRRQLLGQAGLAAGVSGCGG